MKIPKWLKIQEEIDYWHFILNRMLIYEEKLPMLTKMIHKATGYDKEKLKYAKEIIIRIEKLKEKYYKLISPIN